MGNQKSKEIPSAKLLAWCSSTNNKVSILDLETKQEYANFDGVKVSDTANSWTHVREIPNTDLLVSLHHSRDQSANMQIFDISKKGQAMEIYSLGEVKGVPGWGDVTYNVRRNILGTICLSETVSYHLFNVETSASNVNDIVKLNRKSKWHSEYNSKYSNNCVAGLDFNPTGESVATIDNYGVCLISDVNTDSCILNLQLKTIKPYDTFSRCRWSSNTEEPLLYIKYDHYQLNILDVQKKALIRKDPVRLETYLVGTDFDYTHWIDVCPTNGNLLASGGADKGIGVFDKRQSKFAKCFDDVHSRDINCVRWDPRGDMLASSSKDKTVKLLDFKTGKTIYTEQTSDGNSAMSVCFI